MLLSTGKNIRMDDLLACTIRKEIQSSYGNQNELGLTKSPETKEKRLNEAIRCLATGKQLGLK